MTNPTFNIKQGDTAPNLQAVLRDEQRQPKDLSNFNNVRFHMKNVAEQETVVDAAAQVQEAENGLVLYKWSDGDTDIAGRHVAEFEVEYGSGRVETFPNSGNIEVYVEEDIS